MVVLKTRVSSRGISVSYSNRYFVVENETLEEAFIEYRFTEFNNLTAAVVISQTSVNSIAP